MQGTTGGMPEGQGEMSALCFRLQRKILSLSYRGKYETGAWSTAVTSPALREQCGMMRGGFESLQPGKEM